MLFDNHTQQISDGFLRVVKAFGRAEKRAQDDPGGVIPLETVRQLERDLNALLQEHPLRTLDPFTQGAVVRLQAALEFELARVDD
jgi:hypothetical protein